VQPFVPASRHCNQEVRTYVALSKKLMRGEGLLGPGVGALQVTVMFTHHPPSWQRDLALQLLAARAARDSGAGSSRAAAAAAAGSSNGAELRQQLLLAAVEGRHTSGPWRAELVRKPSAPQWRLQAFELGARQLLKYYMQLGYKVVLQEQVRSSVRRLGVPCAQR
jgi:hypothetical protein